MLGKALPRTVDFLGTSCRHKNVQITGLLQARQVLKRTTTLKWQGDVRVVPQGKLLITQAIILHQDDLAAVGYLAIGISHLFHGNLGAL
jgi:hypothetical protein